MAEACENCRFWQRGEQRVAGGGFKTFWDTRDNNGKLLISGRCRYDPPNIEGKWPPAEATSWCGSYEPVETGTNLTLK